MPHPPGGPGSAPVSGTTPLDRFVANSPGPVLVLDDTGAERPADPPVGVTYVESTRTARVDEPWERLVLVVADRAHLRRILAAVPRLGRASGVACLMTEDDVILTLPTRSTLPRVLGLEATRLPGGGSWTAVHFDEAVDAELVLRVLARYAVPRRDLPGASPGSPDEAFDVGVLNPIGFEPDADRGVAVLEADHAGRLHLRGVDGMGEVPPSGARPSMVQALRGHQGVRVTSEPHTSLFARTIAGLAMAGVPLTMAPSTRPGESLLDDGLRRALGATVDLGDALGREEHSVRLRRSALLAHADPRPAAHRFPTCSVVLCTRRPQQLEFALRQVRRQRADGLEVVVVGHGFRPDPALVRDHLRDLPSEVRHVPAEEPFGHALAVGVDATSGVLVLKMDDDDWYGPDFLLDLLLAREYSGADLVGAAAQFVYLEQLDRTVRLREPSERFARLVAGGTMLVSRELLFLLGGFRPVWKFVDRQLLAAAGVAGAGVYRGHGLGYVLRRTSTGHTWDPGLDFFLDEGRVVAQWPGFAPSTVVEVDPLDLPRAGTTRVSGP